MDQWPEVDRRVLDRRAGVLGADGMAEVLGAYVRDFERLVDGLRTGFAQGDVAALERHAHTLKGACASLGADALAQLCAHLEVELRARGTDTPGTLLLDIEQRLARALGEWRALLHEYAARA
ncbi:MAG TPA: Hpt domain-containing protein [Candidatus Binatia bacterium]|nr:Hpt domain-containing protein [Candidatus Binatia bacterium]